MQVVSGGVPWLSSLPFISSLVLLFPLLLLPSSLAFLFSNGDSPHCYELDLEACFRDAFLLMMRSTDRRVRDLPFLSAVNVTTLDRRKLGVQHLLLCNDIRRFSSCFAFSGCTDEYAATIASVQYHMVFGKRLPIQAFLAFRGYGKQTCEQSCSSDALLLCRRGIREISEAEETNLMSEATAISERISQTEDVESACDKFRGTLTELMRVRSEYCGEAAKCLCMEEQLQKGIVFCNAGCEHLLRESHSLSSTSSLFSPSLLIPLITLFHTSFVSLSSGLLQ